MLSKIVLEKRTKSGYYWRLPLFNFLEENFWTLYSCFIIRECKSSFWLPVASLSILHCFYRKLKEWNIYTSSVIKQKDKSQNECYRKTKHAKFSEKQIFLTPLCVSGGKKCSFFGKFGVLYFLGTPILRFAHLPYYRR